MKPENAARNFNNPAPILRRREVVAFLKGRPRAQILELGAGCLRNALYLQRRGFRVSVFEVKAMEGRFPERYAHFRRAGGRVLQKNSARNFDMVLATFVIETICNPRLREEMVRAARRQLMSGGCFVLSVRGPRDLVTASATGKPCSDGYITPNRTFARAYTRAEIHSLLRRCGFERLEFLHKSSTKEPELLHVIAWES